MPLREYECPQCGLFELIEKMSDEPIKICPTCGKEVQKKLSMPGGFVLNGPGFYENDYKNKPESNSVNLKTKNIGFTS